MDAIDRRIGCWSAVGIVWFLALAWAPYTRYDASSDEIVTQYAFLYSPEGWSRDWTAIPVEGIVGTLIFCNCFVGFRPKANRAQRISTGFALTANVCCLTSCLCQGGRGFEPVLAFSFLGLFSTLQWGFLLFLLLIQYDKRDPLRQHR